MRRKALGRGLESLLPPTDTSKVQQISVRSIEPNPDQPRKVFSEESLLELAQSIAEQGILQPVLVRPQGNKFELIIGERRWRAAVEAGLNSIPAIISHHDDDRSLELALVENLQREDLGPLEIAQAYRMLMEQRGLTQEKLAQLVGKKRSSVANYLRLLDLPAEVKEGLQNDNLSMGHARALSGLSSPSLQQSLARRVKQESLSVRQVEDLVRKRNRQLKNQPKKRKKSLRTELHLRAVEEKLSDALGTKVTIVGGRQAGKLVIHYYSPEHLEGLWNRLEQA